MAGYILHGASRDVILRPAEIDRLLQQRDGDAALLYLYLRRTDRGVRPDEAMACLGWSELRLRGAETTLQTLGLIGGDTTRQPLLPPEERAVYSAQDLAEMLRSDEVFRLLVPQTEEKLGKKLKTADLQMLAGLYDDLGLPSDVIYLLVSHCVERTQRRYGAGRRPTMRQIEKEGYYWAQLGLFDQEHAAHYLKDWTDKQALMSGYMQALGLGNRKPVESEQRYITDWINKGFSPDVVALAYDKTVFYKKELNWRYLNGILRRWEENGWHTVEEVERGNAAAEKTVTKKDKKETSRDAQIDKYMKW